jgi:hypothetical protein
MTATFVLFWTAVAFIAIGTAVILLNLGKDTGGSQLSGWAMLLLGLLIVTIFAVIRLGPN